MQWYDWTIGILLLISSVLIVILVLMQQSKDAGLSGAIAGGSDTYFGKNKKRSNDAKLAKITKILTVVFFVLSLCGTFVLAYLHPKG